MALTSLLLHANFLQIFANTLFLAIGYVLMRPRGFLFGLGAIRALVY
jgi:hypothetical protein